MASPGEPKESNEITILSGGADGSDLEWARVAGLLGYRVRVFSFADHKRALGHPHSTKWEELNLKTANKGALAEMTEKLAVAAKRLQKAAPNMRTYPGKLVARNWLIAKNASAMFAITQELASLTPSNLCVGVDGGTGWACQLFADRHLTPFSTNREIPLFLFAQSPGRGAWYQCTIRDRNYAWVELGEDGPPRPETFDTYAGVGTRTLSEAGKQAIRRLCVGSE